MNPIEERLRDAYQAAADTVRPQTVRDLPGQVVRPARRPSSRRTQIILPAAAAAAVAAIAVAATALVPHTQAPGNGSRPATGRLTTAASGLPEFVVIASSTQTPGQADSLLVYDTVSGAVTGTVPLPSGQEFQQVADAGNDRTFVVSTGLSGYTNCEARFYTLRLTAAGKPLPLTLLRSVPGGIPTALAANSDGSTISYAVAHCATGSGSGHMSQNAPIGVVAVAGPNVNRQWTFSLGEDYPINLAISADGAELAFPMFIPSTMNQRGLVLDTASRSKTVAGASRIVVSGPAHVAQGTLPVQSLVISPDAKTLYACTYDGRTAAIAAYDAGTGKQTRLLRRWRTPGNTNLNCELTTDASGRFLLATLQTTTQPSKSNPLLQISTVLTGYDLQVNTAITLPVQVDGEIGWSAAAW